MKKFFKWFFISILICFLAIALAGVIMNMFFKEDIKKIALEKINKTLLTDISIKNEETIKLSLFSNFPYASLQLEDVSILSNNALQKKQFPNISCDTLCTAKNIFLNLSLIQIIQGNYEISEIVIKDANIKLLTDSKGTNNYQLFEKKEKTDSASSFMIELQKVKIINTNLTYINKSNNIYIQTLIDKTDFSGNFNSSISQITVASKIYCRLLSIDGVKYLENKNTSLSTEIQMQKGNFNIKSGTFSLEGLNFGILGMIKNQNNTKNINFLLKGINLDAQSFISMLPEKGKEKLKKIKSNGKIHFEANIAGEIGNSKIPAITAKFAVEDLSINSKGWKHPLENIKANGIFTNGKYRNPSSSLLKLENLKCEINNNPIYCNGQILNFKKPWFSFNTNSSIDLALLHDYIDLQIFTFEKGKADAILKLEGHLSSFKDFSNEEFANFSVKGDVLLTDVDVQIPDYIKIENLSGKLHAKNTIIFKDVTAKVKEDHLNMNGNLINFLPFLFKSDEDLGIELNFLAENFHLQNYLKTSENNAQENVEKTSIPSDTTIFPDNIVIWSNVEINNFVYENLKADQLKGKLKYNKKKFTLSSANISSMGGTITGTTTFSQNKDYSFILETASTLNGVDISALFYSFENFGQSELKSEHLKGRISGRAKVYSHWTNNLDIIPEDLLATVNIEIQDGELNEFEQLYGLSNFINLEELKNIKFSSLRNQIVIKDQKITIPVMNIVSSAISIQCSGEHYFDNSYNYKFQLLLSDIMFNKARKNKAENMEYAEKDDDSDKIKLYLAIEGKDTDYKVKYDRKSKVENRKKDFKEEKEELKNILHDEFGLYKKDSAVLNNNITNTDRPFDVKWDEDDEEKDDTKTNTSTNNNSTIQIEWDDE